MALNIQSFVPASTCKPRICWIFSGFIPKPWGRCIHFVLFKWTYGHGLITELWQHRANPTRIFTMSCILSWGFIQLLTILIPEGTLRCPIVAYIDKCREASEGLHILAFPICENSLCILLCAYISTGKYKFKRAICTILGRDCLLNEKRQI